MPGLKLRDERTMMGVFLEPEVKRRIVEAAQRVGLNMSQFVRMASLRMAAEVEAGQPVALTLVPLVTPPAPAPAVDQTPAPSSSSPATSDWTVGKSRRRRAAPRKAGGAR